MGVAKKNKLAQADHGTLAAEQMEYVKSACLAEFYVERFSKLTEKNVTALPCYLYSLGDEHFCGEDFVGGMCTKWISNSGEISDETGEDVASALAHFSWYFSDGAHMVADIQGVIYDQNYIIFDPQILSTSKCFGPADLGGEGMKNFFCAHRCNEICRSLGLSLEEEVLLLRFGSPPVSRGDGMAKFRELLMNCPQLHVCREALEREGHSWVIERLVVWGPSQYGVLMFVKPD